MDAVYSKASKLTCSLCESYHTTIDHDSGKVGSSSQYGEIRRNADVRLSVSRHFRNSKAQTGTRL